MYCSLLFRCFLLLYVVTICMLNHVAGRMCPHQNHTDIPRFTEELNAADWVRYGRFIGLLCCADGYDEIEWYKKTNITDWHSFPPHSEPSEVAPSVKEHGQVLEFYNAELSDAAWYRCDVIRNGVVALSHIVKLYVIECDKPAQGPVATEPEPRNQTIYDYGGSVTIYCTGYFGCQDDTNDLLEIVRWSVLGSTKMITDISPRYHIKSSQSEQGAIKQSTLTISPVLEEDTERTFICTLASPQRIRGQTQTHVKIFKLERWWIYVVIGVGCLLVVILIIVCLKCLYGPYFRLMFNTMIPKFGPKYITDTNIIWNTYICHADDDVAIATQWKNELENLGYKVIISDDFNYGAIRINDFKEAVTKSALVLFLYSEHFLHDEDTGLYLNMVFSAKESTDIMFLEKTNFKPKEIRNLAAKEAKNVPIEGVEDLSTKVSIEVDADQSMDNDANPEIVQKADDLDKFWKFIPRFKVPKDDSSNRVKRNFLSSLRNNIPRFKEVKKRNVDKIVIPKDRAGSGKPLLEDPPESPTSPVGFENQTLELSPNISPANQNEFDFEQTRVLKVAGNDRRNNTPKFDGCSPNSNVHENGFISNPNNQIYVEGTPIGNNVNVEILTDAIVHDTNVKTDENNREHQNNHTQGNGPQYMPNEPTNPKESIFTMSGDEENQSCFPNKESAFMSSGEESARGGNPNSNNNRVTSPSSSSCQSSSGFESQSPSTSSPTNFSDQSVSPKDEFSGHNFSERGQVLHDGKNVQVINEQLNGSSRSPEEGYVTSSYNQFFNA